MYKKVEYSKDNPPRCPICGCNMAVRTAKKGKYKGKKFWGCSNYPRCKGIVEYYGVHYEYNNINAPEEKKVKQIAKKILWTIIGLAIIVAGCALELFEDTFNPSGFHGRRYWPPLLLGGTIGIIIIIITWKPEK